MPDFNTIDAPTLKRWMDQNKDMAVFDVLSADSYEAKHVPGAINAPVKRGDFLEVITKHVENKKKPVIVYCASESCQLSPAAAQKLVDAGYGEVYDFEAGLAGWQEAGYSFAE